MLIHRDFSFDLSNTFFVICFLLTRFCIARGRYEELMADLNRWAEGAEPGRLPAYRHRVRQHCVARFPSDDR